MINKSIIIIFHHVENSILMSPLCTKWLFCIYICNSAGRELNNRGFGFLVNYKSELAGMIDSVKIFKSCLWLKALFINDQSYITPFTTQ